MSAKDLSECDINLTNGPIDTYPAVLRSLSKTAIFDYDPTFRQFYQDVHEKLRIVMRMPIKPVILQGESVIGLEASAGAIIAPEDKVLNLVTGFYSKAFEKYAARYAKGVVELKFEPDDIIDPDAVRAALKADPEIRVVAMVHHETPAGTINPLEEIGEIVREHDAYLIADTTSSFGGMNVHPEDAKTDLFVTTFHKCLGGTPGLGIVGVSERAWEKISKNPQAVRNSYISLVDWAEAWRLENRFAFTPIVSVINALDTSLDLYLEEGPENVWRRHLVTAETFRAGIKAMGLKLWPKKIESYAPMTTAVRLPEGVSDTALRTEIHTRYRVQTAPGIGNTAGKIIRFGHMAKNAQPLYAMAGLTALGGALENLGHKVDLRAGLGEAAAYMQNNIQSAAMSVKDDHKRLRAS